MRDLKRATPFVPSKHDISGPTRVGERECRVSERVREGESGEERKRVRAIGFESKNEKLKKATYLLCFAIEAHHCRRLLLFGSSEGGKQGTAGVTRDAGCIRVHPQIA